MTVYEIPNIEHCTVTPKSGGRGFLIVANDGWYIHCPEHEENSYTTAVMLVATYDFSTVQILPISSLDGDYEINGNITEQPEIM